MDYPNPVPTSTYNQEQALSRCTSSEQSKISCHIEFHKISHKLLLYSHNHMKIRNKYEINMINFNIL